MLIVVEGKEYKEFIEAYLEHLQLKNMTEKFLVQVSGGKNDIQSVKEIEKHDRIKIIFDADDDFEKAKKNIENQITKTFQEDILKNVKFFSFRIMTKKIKEEDKL